MGNIVIKVYQLIDFYLLPGMHADERCRINIIHIAGDPVPRVVETDIFHVFDFMHSSGKSMIPRRRMIKIMAIKYASAFLSVFRLIRSVALLIAGNHN